MTMPIVMWMSLKLERKHTQRLHCMWWTIYEIDMYLSHKNQNIGVNQNEVMDPGLVMNEHYNEWELKQWHVYTPCFYKGGWETESKD